MRFKSDVSIELSLFSLCARKLRALLFDLFRSNVYQYRVGCCQFIECAIKIELLNSLILRHIGGWVNMHRHSFSTIAIIVQRVHSHTHIKCTAPFDALNAPFNAIRRANKLQKKKKNRHAGHINVSQIRGQQQ